MTSKPGSRVFLHRNDPLAIPPLQGPCNATLTIPGSKSITNRALVISALAKGDSILENVLFSDDTRYMIGALEKLGVSFEIDETDRKIVVHGTGGKLTSPGDPIFVGNAGTCMRFLSSVVSLGKGEFILDGVQRMRERPIQDLIDGLRGLGVDISSINGNGCPPVRVRGGGIEGGSITMPGNVSSQYFSSILLAAPLARRNVTVRVKGRLVSRPYVEMTTRMMEAFGAKVEWVDAETIRVQAGVPYRPRHYLVESDYSSASYFMGAAAITDGRVELRQFAKPSLQGDSFFGEILERMGARVKQVGDKVITEGTGRLEGIDVDLFECSDLVPTVAVVAMFAKGITRILNVANVRVKESDRLSAIANEMTRLGGIVKEYPDGLEIHGREPSSYHGAVIHTYDDHRIAMAFSLAGLKVDGVKIQDPGCVAKTFPGFYDCLEKLYP